VRKVVAYELLSLDGVAQDPDVFITDWDQEMDENLARVIGTQDTVLLGRRTYDEWSQFWPPSEIEPFAAFINGVEKFLWTSSTPTTTWSNTTVVSDGFPELVTELKGRPGGDIGIHASLTVVQSLLAAGLVDELRLVIAPALQVQGRKLFDKVRATRLELTRHVASSTGYLLLDFAVASGG
jgi:dihydrofolate reductase